MTPTHNHMHDNDNSSTAFTSYVIFATQTIDFFSDRAGIDAISTKPKSAFRLSFRSSRCYEYYIYIIIVIIFSN